MRKKQEDHNNDKKSDGPSSTENSADGVVENIAESMGVEPLETAGDAPAAELSEADVLKQQVAKLANDILYLRAEYDNYRRQAIKERSDMMKYAGERLAKDLLDTLDIFDTAMASEVTAENWSDFLKGIQLTAQQLRSTLNKHGITEIPSHGEPFNPVHHEAIASEPTDALPPGHVSKIFKKAYKYQDKVLRPGQVVIAKEK